MSEDLVTLDITEGVADVRLNRANKYNALSPEMFTAIHLAGEKLSQAKEVRSVVLSGNGNGFCAGLDCPVLREWQTPLALEKLKNPSKSNARNQQIMLSRRLIYGKIYLCLLLQLSTELHTAEGLKLP